MTTSPMVFLGKSVDGGASDGMRAKLQAVEPALGVLYNVAVAAGMFAGTFEDWCSIRETYKGAHTGGFHTSGDAIDVNFNSNPYIATRTPAPAGQVTYGGESTPLAMRMARVAATVVYDRAMAFGSSSTTVANVSARARLETTFSVFSRIAAASSALKAYLNMVFPSTLPGTNTPPPPVGRVPLAGAQFASLAILQAIPLSERFDDATARTNIATALAAGTFAAQHPGWSTDVDFWFRQILSDYEVVRIPMVIGDPALAPGTTRNPANGFLDLRQEIVIALADQPLTATMRWGVCDFGREASGDVQHFDLAARIDSLVDGVSPPEVRIDLTAVAGVQQAPRPWVLIQGRWMEERVVRPRMQSINTARRNSRRFRPAASMIPLSKALAPP